MAKSPRRRSTASRASRTEAAPRRRTATAPPGPVTLAEARRLARAPGPSRGGAARTTAAAARRAPPPAPAAGPRAASPEPVGRARERLGERRREVIARRERDYAATMAVMKARGARAPAGPAAAAAAAGTGFVPLQLLAEGDSWFDYPVPFFGGGIIDRLERRVGVPILNLAEAGDEVRFMLGVEQRNRLAARLAAGCPAGGPWEALLFSGGGNDIVGNPMALWVRDWDPGRPPADHVHAARFGAALAMVRAGFEDLIGLRDALSPTTHVVVHAYDFAIPDGRGICHLGPWLKPTFDLHRFPSRAAGAEVVRAMLTEFAGMLAALAAAAPRVTFLNGQGTLPAQTGAWHNELHPASAGFDAFAGLFHATLRGLFPGRTL